MELIAHTGLMMSGLRKDAEIIWAHLVHFVTALYGRQSGRYPVHIRVGSPVYDSGGQYLPRVKKTPLLDAVALLDEGGDELALFVINRSLEPLTASIALQEFLPLGEDLV